MKSGTGCLNYIIIVIIILLVFIAVNIYTKEDFQSDRVMLRYPRYLGMFAEDVTPNKLYGDWYSYDQNIENLNCISRSMQIENSGQNIPYDVTIEDSLNIVTPEELLNAE